MVNECHTVYASLVGVSENNVDVLSLQFLNEIILAGVLGKSVGNFTLGWSNVNLILRTLEASFYGIPSGKLAQP